MNDPVYELTVYTANGKIARQGRFNDCFFLECLASWTSLDLEVLITGGTYDPLSFDGMQDSHGHTVGVRECSPYSIVIVYASGEVYTDSNFVSFDSARDEFDSLWILEENRYSWEQSAYLACISHTEFNHTVIDYLVSFEQE